MFSKQCPVLPKIETTMAEELIERKHQVRRELLRTGQDEKLGVIARSKRQFSLYSPAAAKSVGVLTKPPGAESGSPRG